MDLKPCPAIEHTEAPVFEENSPGAVQAGQDAAPPSEAVPASHGMQAVRASLECVPGGHIVHVVEAPSEILPCASEARTKDQ